MNNPSKPFQWRDHTGDPNDAATQVLFLEFLRQRRVLLPARENETLEFFIDVARGKSVLDIGVCAHTGDYIESPIWRHGHIVKAASHCLGIDILKDLIDSLAAKGFNVKHVDALSDVDLGERFDSIICGDVIEHVENPVKLLQFSRRHLADGGRLFVSTPNPHCLHVLKNVFSKGTMVANFDHVTWHSPCTMTEAASRAGLQLFSYYLFVGSQNPLKNLIKKIFPAEMQPLTIVYELGI